jgi:hypothetical protein
MASAAVVCSPQVVETSGTDPRDITMTVNLTVQMLTGKMVAQASFLASAPISTVKDEVHAAVGIPVRHQKLIWQSEVLADDCVLSDLALPTSDAVLVLVVSLPPDEQVEMARHLIMEAAAALDVIHVRDLSELKNLPMPPAPVYSALGAVMELLAGISPAIEVDSKGKLKDFSWKSVRKMIKDPNKLLKELRGFPRMIENGHVPVRNIQGARRIRDNYGPHFTPEAMAGTSKAAAGVVRWVLGILMYYEVVSAIRAQFEGFDIMAEIRDRLGQ